MRTGFSPSGTDASPFTWISLMEYYFLYALSCFMNCIGSGVGCLWRARTRLRIFIWTQIRWNEGNFLKENKVTNVARSVSSWRYSLFFCVYTITVSSGQETFPVYLAQNLYVSLWLIGENVSRLFCPVIRRFLSKCLLSYILAYCVRCSITRFSRHFVALT